MLLGFHLQCCLNWVSEISPLFSSRRLDRMLHRKWRGTKQQLIWWPNLALLGCYLVSLHFLWAINSINCSEFADDGRVAHRPPEDKEWGDRPWHTGVGVEPGNDHIQGAALILLDARRITTWSDKRDREALLYSKFNHVLTKEGSRCHQRMVCNYQKSVSWAHQK